MPNCAQLCTNKGEMHRFPQLLVNSVMTTYIMDKEFGAQRKAQWNSAFDEQASKQSITAEERVEKDPAKFGDCELADKTLIVIGLSHIGS